MRRSCAAIVVVLVIARASEARELVVPDEYPNIQAAVDAALPNDTILVQPGGVYNGEVVIQGAQSLTLTGLGAGELRALVANTGGYAFRILGSQHVVVSNLRINAVDAFRVGPDQLDVAIESNEIRTNSSAVRMRGGSEHRIVANDIRALGDTAIRVREADTIAVTGNTLVKSGGHGIRVRESSQVSIEDNQVFESLRDGIRIFECSSVTIGAEGAGNTSSRNRASGIRIRGSVDAAIGSNVTNANRRYGIRVLDTAAVDEVSDLTDAGNEGECNVEADFRVENARASGTCNASTTTTSTSTTTTVLF